MDFAAFPLLFLSLYSTQHCTEGCYNLSGVKTYSSDKNNMAQEILFIWLFLFLSLTRTHMHAHTHAHLNLFTFVQVQSFRTRFIQLKYFKAEASNLAICQILLLTAWFFCGLQDKRWFYISNNLPFIFWESLNSNFCLYLLHIEIIDMYHHTQHILKYFIFN